MNGKPKREQSASRIGLVLAVSGYAVGLGNFLRIPAQAVKNGGGAFVIPDMVAFLLLGLPLMWIEWTMRRYGGQFGHHSTPGIFDSMGRRWFWKYFGMFGMWSNLIIVSYYLDCESWCMAYAGDSLMNGFQKTLPAEFFQTLTDGYVGAIFAVGILALIVFLSCTAINRGFLSRGLAKSIKFVSTIGMPLLILVAAALADSRKVEGRLTIP